MTTDHPAAAPAASPAAELPPDGPPGMADGSEPGPAAPESPAAESPAEAEPEAPPSPGADDAAETAAQAPADDAAAPPEAKPSSKHWYVVKVQSGREETVKEAIERRVKIEGLEQYFGQVVVPVERETITIQNGKRKGQKMVKKKKKFPGYIMAEVEYNDKILYLFRETSGVGDFVGGTITRAPNPMSDREVESMLRDQDDPKLPPGEKRKKSVAAAPVKLPFGVGDKVRVRDGIFAGQEGEIKEIKEPKDASETHRISVELTVFGRPTRVQLEHWQIENV